MVAAGGPLPSIRGATGGRPVNVRDMLPLLVPLIVLELGLLIAALYDLTRPGRRVRGDSRLLWGLVIVFIGIFGPIVYFLVGREPS